MSGVDKYVQKDKQTINFLVEYVELLYIWELDRLNITVMMGIVYNNEAPFGGGGYLVPRLNF